MTLKVEDRVQETTTSTGSGSLTLAGAAARMRSFQGAGFQEGDTGWCLIEHSTAAEWEIALCTYHEGSPAYITRAETSKSSTGSTVAFSAGTKAVSLILPANALFSDAEALNEAVDAAAGSAEEAAAAKDLAASSASAAGSSAIAAAAAVSSVQTMALRELAARRNWPVLPAFSAIAVKEELLPAELVFDREGAARRVNAKGIIESAANDVMRHGYSAASGDYLGILIEPAITNRWQRSEDASHSDIAKSSVTVTANSGLGADGTMTADKIVEAAATTSHYISNTRSSVTVAQVWSLAFWVRPKERANLRLELANNGSTANLVASNFILSGAGAVSRTINGGNGSGARARITAYPGGLYRVYLSGKPDTSGTAIRARLYLLNGDTAGTSYTGDGVSGLEVDRAQLKEGRGAGSYVPNAASSTTTSVADALSIPTPSAWFSAARGAVYYEFVESESAGAVRTLLPISDGTGDEAIILRVTADDRIEAEAIAGGVSQGVATGSYVAESDTHRVIVGWDDGVLTLCADGVEPVSAEMASTPATTRIDFGGACPHYYKHFAGFPRVPAAADMRTLTQPDRFTEAEDAIEETVVDGFFVTRAIGPNGAVYPMTANSTAPVVTAAASRVLGALSDAGFAFHFDATTAGSVTWEVATEDTFDNVVASGGPLAPVQREGLTQTYFTHAVVVSGLTAATEYFVRLAFDGNVDSGYSFNVTTLPTDGSAASHRIVEFSCLNPSSSAEEMPAFTAMAGEDADFAICIGDWCYPEYSVDDVRRQRATMRIPLANPQVQALLKVSSFIYLFDDHDGFKNNFDRHSTVPNPSTTALDIIENTIEAYGEVFPHYDFVHAGSGPDSVITMVKDVGKVRHLFVDDRSQRSWNGEASPTVLGTGTVPAGSWDQVSWLKGALVQAGTDGCLLVVLHLSSLPHDGKEGWYTRAPAEYVDFCDYVRDTAGIPSIVMIAGDIHHSIADSGVYVDEATGGGFGVPLVATSAVHLSSSGGEVQKADWNGSGAFGTRIINNRQYIVGDFADDGTWEIVLKGAPFDADTGAATVLATYAWDDATPAVDFHTDTATAGSGETFSVAVDKTWFGPIGELDGDGGTATVDWTTDEGSPQAGTLSIRPNCKTYTITGTMPLSGSIVLTLSNPSSGLSLGPQTTITVNPA